MSMAHVLVLVDRIVWSDQYAKTPFLAMNLIKRFGLLPRDIIPRIILCCTPPEYVSYPYEYQVWQSVRRQQIAFQPFKISCVARLRDQVCKMRPPGGEYEYRIIFLATADPSCCTLLHSLKKIEPCHPFLRYPIIRSI
jgi:hypothetical protein